MNTKKKAAWYAIGGLLTLAIVAGLAHAANVVYSATLSNETALAYNNTYVVDLQAAGVGALSAQAVYSSATVPSQTFQDGTQSTGSFTVLSNTGLSTATATNNITVADNTSLAGSYIQLPGAILYNGIDWATQDVASNTATSLASALATVPGLLVSHPAGTAVIYTTAPAYGAFYNSWGLTSSAPSALVVATPNFTGGADNAVVAINGVRLRQGTDWWAGASAGATATNIAAAINANSLLSKLVHAQAIGSVITSTSVLANVNAFLQTTSTPTAISRNNPTMTGGTAPSFALSGHSISAPGHSFTLALPVLYTKSGVSLGGLTDQTTYYAIPVDANTIALASTANNAIAGTYITFTSTTTQLSAHTATLSALPITGIPSFKWQVSNDNSNWFDLAVTSITMGATGTPYAIPATNTFWSFGYLQNRYLRLNATAPTTGGIILKTTVVGTN